MFELSGRETGRKHRLEDQLLKRATRNPEFSQFPSRLDYGMILAGC